MSWLDKILKRNNAGEAVPQYYNPTTNDYEVLHGSAGAALMQLTGSNIPESQAVPIKVVNSSVKVVVLQLVNAKTLSAGGFDGAIFFDLQDAQDIQVWVSADRAYDLTFYPTLTASDVNLPITVEALASNAAALATGRTAVYKPTKLPAFSGKLGITNRDASLSMTYSIWVVKALRI